jgi:ACS family sodium-dependent inorganic phosphate cotransporter
MAYIAARVESEKQPLVQLATRTHPDAAGSPECSTAEALAGPDGGIVGRQHPQHMLPVRVTMGMLMCSAWIVAYSDRTNISLAIIAMEEDLGFDTQVDGMVFGAFFGGYVFTQILGGWSAGRWGGKRVLAFAVAMWSLWTALTPPAARSSVLALVVCRVMLGLGEGLALPALHHVTAQWSPAHERSRFVAFVTSGQHIGKAVALACSPLVALHWPVIFYLFATMGALWLLVWMRFAASSPAEHPTISDEERMLIAGTSARPPDRQDNESQQGQTSKDEPLVVPWVKICKEPAFIGAVLCHFGHKSVLQHLSIVV